MAQDGKMLLQKIPLYLLVVFCSTSFAKEGVEYEDFKRSYTAAVIDKTSAVAPSCYACHGKKWSQDVPPPRSNAPVDHIINSFGRMHKPGRETPFKVVKTATGPGESGACFVCHGDNLEGGILENGKRPPTCFLCHEQVWNPSIDDRPLNFNPPATEHGPDNGVVFRGRRHGVSHATPFVFNPTGGAPLCAGCHGDNLTGDRPSFNGTTAPSCYTCHNQRWASGSMRSLNPTSDHGDIGGGVTIRGRRHRSGHLNPSQYPADPYNVAPGESFGLCPICHGGDSLTGGDDLAATGKQPPSCYTCHNQRWNGPVVNPPSKFCICVSFGPESCPVNIHTNNFRGRRHRDGYYDPINVGGCRGCHGLGLQGNGNTRPSCYLCHGSEWEN